MFWSPVTKRPCQMPCRTPTSMPSSSITTLWASRLATVTEPIELVCASTTMMSCAPAGREKKDRRSWSCSLSSCWGFDRSKLKQRAALEREWGRWKEDEYLVARYVDTLNTTDKAAEDQLAVLPHTSLKEKWLLPLLIYRGVMNR